MRVCTITASWVFWHRATTYRSHLVISPIMLISSYFKWCFLNWYMQLYKIHTYTHIPTCTHIHTYWHAQDMHKPAPPLKCKYTIHSDTICSNYSFGKFPGEKLPPAGFELPPTFLLYHNERHVSGIFENCRKKRDVCSYKGSSPSHYSEDAGRAGFFKSRESLRFRWSML